jgi:hypothetical protein
MNGQQHAKKKMALKQWLKKNPDIAASPVGEQHCIKASWTQRVR